MFSMSDLQLLSAKMTQHRVYIRNLHFLITKNAITWELINWGLNDGLQKIVLMRPLYSSAMTHQCCSGYLIFCTEAQALAVVQHWNGANIPSLGPQPLGCAIAIDLPTAPSKSKPSGASSKPAAASPADSPQPPAFAPAPSGCGMSYRACPVLPPHHFTRPPTAAANISAATQQKQPKTSPPVPPPPVPPPPLPPPPVPPAPVSLVPPAPPVPPQAATRPTIPSPSPKLSSVSVAPSSPPHVSAAPEAVAQLGPYEKKLYEGITKCYIIPKQKHHPPPRQSSSSSTHEQAVPDDQGNEGPIPVPEFLTAWGIEAPYPYPVEAKPYFKLVFKITTMLFTK
jgi:hypothetical protein